MVAAMLATLRGRNSVANNNLLFEDEEQSTSRKGKSARMKWAKAQGESYHPPPELAVESGQNDSGVDDSAKPKSTDQGDDDVPEIDSCSKSKNNNDDDLIIKLKAKAKAARKLKSDVEALEKDETLKPRINDQRNQKQVQSLWKPRVVQVWFGGGMIVVLSWRLSIAVFRT